MSGCIALKLQSIIKSNKMTSSIEFFCTPEEEARVWQFLKKPEVTSRLIDPFDSNSVTMVDYSLLPDWPEPIAIFFHHTTSGPLQWYFQQPSLNYKTHGTLVSTLLAREKWKDLNLQTGSALLDLDHSPLQIYFRGVIKDGQIGPCQLRCPPSNTSQISDEYKKWTEQSKSWIRRNSVRIHDWKHRSEILNNPLRLLNSIYAFPKAKEEIELKPDKYAILIR